MQQPKQQLMQQPMQQHIPYQQPPPMQQSAQPVIIMQPGMQSLQHTQMQPNQNQMPPQAHQRIVNNGGLMRQYRQTQLVGNQPMVRQNLYLVQPIAKNYLPMNQMNSVHGEKNE